MSWLKFAAVALAIQAVIHVAQWIWWMNGATSQWLDDVRGASLLILALAGDLALLLFARSTARRDLRWPAAVAGALMLAGHGFWLLQWTEYRFDWTDLALDGGSKPWAWAMNLAWLAGPVAVLALVQRAWPAMSGARLALIGLGVAWTSGIPLWELATSSGTLGWLLDTNPWWWVALVQGGAALTLLALAAALWRADTAAAEGPGDLHRGWPDVAVGLRRYGDGLAWRIAITFIGIFLGFMAVMAHSSGMARVVGVAVPLGGVLTGLVMLAGMASYARQPVGSPGAAPAWITFACMLLATALDLAAFVLLVKLLASDRHGLLELVDQGFERSTGKMSRWSLAMAAVSLGSLLLSFALVGVHLRRTDVIRRVVSTVTFFVVATGAVIGFFAYGFQVRTVGGAFMAIIALLVLVLACAIYFLGLVRRVEVAVFEQGADHRLPPARLIKE